MKKFFDADLKKKILVTAGIVIATVLVIVMISVILPKDNDGSIGGGGIHYPSTAFSADSVLVPTGKGSDVEGMSLSVKSYDLGAEYPFIEVLWKNETDKQATYGLNYDVQKNINGVWTSCAIDSVIVPSIACMISPGEENAHQYNLSYFDIDKGAKYRFVTECYVADEGTGEYPDKCDMYVEFDIV